MIHVMRILTIMAYFILFSIYSICNAQDMQKNGMPFTIANDFRLEIINHKNGTYTDDVFRSIVRKNDVITTTSDNIIKNLYSRQFMNGAIPTIISSGQTNVIVAYYNTYCDIVLFVKFAIDDITHVRIDDMFALEGATLSKVTRKSDKMFYIGVVDFIEMGFADRIAYRMKEVFQEFGSNSYDDAKKMLTNLNNDEHQYMQFMTLIIGIGNLIKDEFARNGINMIINAIETGDVDSISKIGWIKLTTPLNVSFLPKELRSDLTFEFSFGNPDRYVVYISPKANPWISMSVKMSEKNHELIVDSILVFDLLKNVPLQP